MRQSQAVRVGAPRGPAINRSQPSAHLGCLRRRHGNPVGERSCAELAWTEVSINQGNLEEFSDPHGAGERLVPAGRRRSPPCGKRGGTYQPHQQFRGTQNRGHGRTPLGRAETWSSSWALPPRLLGAAHTRQSQRSSEAGVQGLGLPGRALHIEGCAAHFGGPLPCREAWGSGARGAPLGSSEQLRTRA